MPSDLPPYLRQILADHAAGAFPRGKVSVVEVAHDATCPILADAGLCRCNPEVRFVPAEPVRT